MPGPLSRDEAATRNLAPRRMILLRDFQTGFHFFGPDRHQLIFDAGRAVPAESNHAFTGIEWNTPGRVAMSGDWGIMTVARCIVTVPTSVLAEDVIRFDPQLPVE